MKTKKSKLIATAAALGCLVVSYIVTSQPIPGWVIWLGGLPAAAIVAITALVRGNNIPDEVQNWRSHVRRASFLFAGLAACIFSLKPLYGVWPNSTTMLGLWGVAGCWLTTPHMPPWWDYISGKKKLKWNDSL